MKEFTINNPKEVEAWCMRFIGPRSYYLHNRLGGEGWTIKQHQSIYASVKIEDDKQALLSMIKFGK